MICHIRKCERSCSGSRSVYLCQKHLQILCSFTSAKMGPYTIFKKMVNITTQNIAAYTTSTQDIFFSCYSQ